MPLRPHFPQCPIWLFLHFLNFIFSRYVGQVFSAWFWNGSSHPCYYRCHLSFHIPYATNFYYEVLMLKSFQLLSWSHFCIQELQHCTVIIFLILAHPVYKIWIIREPNTLDLWNKRHFEEEKTESIYLV